MRPSLQVIKSSRSIFLGRKALIASIATILVILLSSSLSAFAFGNQPVSSHPIQRITNSTSTNWSGFATESSLSSPSNNFVQSVSGSWTVPSLTCMQGQATYVAVWVGIDGYSSSTVEQTGTEQECSSSGVQTYYAWYEMYPHPMISLFNVKPGDTMTASVASVGGGNFQLTITDTSTGKSQTVSQTLHQAKLQSAEWIVEAPYSGGVLPLADFGTATFSSANFTSNGITYPIDGIGTYDNITMVDPANGATSTPLTIIDSGSSSSFSVVYGLSSATTSTSTSSTSTSTSTTSTSGSLGVAIACDSSTCSYPTNTWAYITVTVSNSGGTVSGASVTLSITNSNGGISSGSGTTNSAGQVIFKYRISPQAPPGPYQMLATATYGGSSGSGSGTLQVA